MHSNAMEDSEKIDYSLSADFLNCWDENDDDDGGHNTITTHHQENYGQHSGRGSERENSRPNQSRGSSRNSGSSSRAQSPSPAPLQASNNNNNDWLCTLPSMSTSGLSSSFDMQGLSRLSSFQMMPDTRTGTAVGHFDENTKNETPTTNIPQMMNGFPQHMLVPFNNGYVPWNQLAMAGPASHGVQSPMVLPQHMMMMMMHGSLQGGGQGRDQAGQVAVSTPISTSLRNDHSSPSESGTGTITSGSSGDNGHHAPVTNRGGSSHPSLGSTNHTSSDQSSSKASQLLHPLGIQSSANCPPHLSSNGTQGTSCLPMMYDPALQTPSLSTMAGHQELLAMYHASQQQMAAQTSSTQSNGNPDSASLKQTPVLASTNPRDQLDLNGKTNTTSSSSTSSQPVPPFLLFDATCELRTNFLQTQLMHNLPITPDSNSFHYGMAVNGFHPQLNAQVNPVLPLSSHAVPLPTGTSVQLVDSRHRKKRGTGKERNEREQKRAQKITELIEKLRYSMEKGGWKVEMKSKYHTLSTCADYVKHLIQTTNEKEAAVNQARADLEVRERKLDEDRSVSESRSDPESVTSNLTSSTTAELGPPRKEHEGNQVLSGSGSRIDNKRKAHELKVDFDESDNISKSRKINDSVGSSVEYSSGDEIVTRIHAMRTLGKMSSSVSDMTDSNRGSSDGGGASHRHWVQRKYDDETSVITPSSTISSTGAVAGGTGGRNGKREHAEVIVNGTQGTRARREQTSLEQSFELDFEEVFVTSNVPQLIATPAGRIVTYNDFFLKATGLNKDDVSRLTIFSIVQADKLANLFELVAEALRHGPLEQTSETASSTTSTSSGKTSQETRPSGEASNAGNPSKPMNYAAMTLPCISFPASRERQAVATSHHPNPLYMTVTLMMDDDPRRRFFHCVLTDCPGTNGSLGFITPELLAMLFKKHKGDDIFDLKKADKRKTSKGLTSSQIDEMAWTATTAEDVLVDSDAYGDE